MNATETDEVDKIYKNGFIQLGIMYAQLFEKDRAKFKELFTKCSSVRSVCTCVYFAYFANGLIEAVLPIEGESKERYIGRKILAVINIIIQ